jgi:hypothetical protein
MKKTTLTTIALLVAMVATAGPTIRIQRLANPALTSVSLGSPPSELWDIAVSTNLTDWTPVPVGSWCNIHSSTNNLDSPVRTYTVTNGQHQFFKPVFRRFVTPESTRKTAP